MPSAIKHDHEFADNGLVTILTEAQGANAAQLEAFLWKTFPDNDCFTCTGAFVPLPESKGIPHAGVIGVDGTLLWAGNPLGDPKKIEELITQELAKVKKGWGDTPESKKVRAALYGKNDFAGAMALVEAMAAGDERTKLEAEVKARHASAVKAVGALKDQGRWLAAQQRAKGVLKSVGTRAEWVTEAQALVAEFETDAGKAEVALDKKVDKVVALLRDKKGDNAPKQLQAMLKDGASTKVGERAQRILTALQTPLK